MAENTGSQSSLTVRDICTTLGNIEEASRALGQALSRLDPDKIVVPLFAKSIPGPPPPQVMGTCAKPIWDVQSPITVRVLWSGLWAMTYGAAGILEGLGGLDQEKPIGE